MSPVAFLRLLGTYDRTITSCRQGAVLAILTVDARAFRETDTRSRAAFWVRQRTDVGCASVLNMNVEHALLILVHYLRITWPHVELDQRLSTPRTSKLEGLQVRDCGSGSVCWFRIYDFVKIGRCEDAGTSGNYFFSA